MNQEDIVSGYVEEQPMAPTSGIDFSAAERLERSGMTCDAYVTRYQRRRVFVKRLKPQFHDSPRHRAALDKEYDVGVSLKHPALPDYREIRDDYIVMDYVDGVTIADMIGQRDGWFRSDRNVRRMLLQLVDVVDYLHQHHVVHCDIKFDNVMLTCGTRDVMLIDLGNCYTDWLDDTSGAPQKYGLSPEQVGNPDIDYRGIGHIAEAVAAVAGNRVPKRFRKICRKEGVTADELRDALNHRSRPAWIWITAAIALVLIATGVLLSRRPSATPAADTPGITRDSVPATPQIHPEIDHADNQAVTPTALPPDKNAHDNSTNTVATMPTSKELTAIIAPMLATLKPSLDHLEKVAADSTLSGSEMLDILRDYADQEQSTLTSTFASVRQRYPHAAYDSLYNAFYNSAAYTGHISRSNRIQRDLSTTARNRLRSSRR